MSARTAVAIVVLGTLAPIASAADWPQALGPNRDSHSIETGLQTRWGKGGPPVAWTNDVGRGFAGVAVAEGKVALFHRVGNDEKLAAFDAGTGKAIWGFVSKTKYIDDFDFDNGPRCVPLIAGGKVFALGADGDLHAVDFTNGKKLWSINIRTEYKPPKGYFGVGSGPILLKDGIASKLLLNVGGKGAGIVAFDPETGKELWKATDDPPGYAAPVQVALNGKPTAAFFTRSGLVWTDAAGTVLFTHPWRSRLDASVNAASPVVRGSNVLLTSSYGTGAILLRPKGKELEEVWSNDTSLSCQFNTPVLVGDYLYGVHGRQEGGSAKLRCVDWKTGAVKWSVDQFGCASLIAVDGVILAVTEGGDLVSFAAEPTAYKELDRRTILDGTVRALPALADGKLYVRNANKLVCLNLKK